MLTSDEFIQWCQQLVLTEQAVKQICVIRSSPPARVVRSAVGNVSGRYPSQKMGQTIQFESHRNELAGIYEMEYDPSVLEYYDQPPSIKLCYQALNGRRVGVLHTPDFFVMRRQSAGWEEWKTTQQLSKLLEKMPQRYQLENSGQWRCPPGESLASELGLYYRIRSDSEINWNLQRNLRLLEDYFRIPQLKVSEPESEKIIALVSCLGGITLSELLECGMKRDDIYTMIATQRIYVDLHSSSLVSEPHKVQVFANKLSAVALNDFQLSNVNSLSQAISVTVGMKGIWNGKSWSIVNIGETITALIGEEEKIIQLPNSEFEKIVLSGEFRVKTHQESSTGIGEILIKASPEDCTEANRRYQIIAPYLRGGTPAFTEIPARTFYRWLASWRQAEAEYGYGYIGLLPKTSHRGNKAQKLPETTNKIIDEFIETDYENCKQKGKFAAYSALQKACSDKGLTPPSYKTFATRINQRPRHSQILKRQGKRAAYQHEPFYWELAQSTPRHGDRPFEICHIDHTELDIELVSSQTSANLGRPWATFLSDAYSRRILAMYLTFDPPSYRSCMMVMRECVRRHGRLPSTLIVDGGKEFQSIYFERLLATYACIKKTRPSAKPRFGSVCERLFGTANTMLIHNLQGNTQITRNPRVVTKTVNPRKIAIWTLSNLYICLCDWAYEFYDLKEHPALGVSPRMAYESGLLQTGLRLQRLIRYSETFRILTLPTTPKGTAKIVPNLGVKINHIYYWHNSFRLAEIEKTQVPVRYDPYDVGIAYAFIKGQWVNCVSQHYSSFAGHSEREIMAASVELRKQHQNHSKQLTITASQLAEFLANCEAQEVVLLQRLRDIEAKSVLSVMDGCLVHSSQEKTQQENVLTDSKQSPTSASLDEETPEEIEPYSEFW